MVFQRAWGRRTQPRRMCVNCGPGELWRMLGNDSGDSDRPGESQPYHVYPVHALTSDIRTSEAADRRQAAVGRAGAPPTCADPTAP
ncbi:hypothetical protein GN956_G19551 [Arapaima gigas]